MRKGVEWIGAHQPGPDRIVSTLLVRECGARETSRSLLDIDSRVAEGAEAHEKHHVTSHFRAALPGKRSSSAFIDGH